MTFGEETASRGAPPESAEGLAEVTDIFINQRPPQEGVFNSVGKFLRDARNLGELTINNTVDGIREFGHDLVHGGYDEQFLSEFHEQRRPFISEKGLKLTFRILNPQFIGNGEHAAVYTFSLAVPGKHGCEIPSLEKLALNCRERQRPFIAVTSPGMAGPVSMEELRLLTHFEETPHAIMEGLRTILPAETPLVLLGASWGGMKTYKMAEIAPGEAERTGHNLPVTHAIPVVSAGHKQLYPWDMFRIGKQWLIDEPLKGKRYVMAGETPKEKAQRFFELMGTMPRHPSQVAAIGATIISIASAPLREVHLQPETEYDDLAFAGDHSTSPQYHKTFIEDSGHPNARSEIRDGFHLDLLDEGLEFMLEKLGSVPQNSTSQVA